MPAKGAVAAADVGGGENLDSRVWHADHHHVHHHKFQPKLAVDLRARESRIVPGDIEVDEQCQSLR